MICLFGAWLSQLLFSALKIEFYKKKKILLEKSQSQQTVTQNHFGLFYVFSLYLCCPYKCKAIFQFNLVTLSVPKDQPVLPINNQIKISKQQCLCLRPCICSGDSTSQICSILKCHIVLICLLKRKKNCMTAWIGPATLTFSNG